MDDSTAQPQGLSPALRAQGDEGLSTVIDEILTAQSTALSPALRAQEVSVHELKTLAPYWDAVASGAKTFEVRRDDRGFQKGDILKLHRLCPDTNRHYDTDPAAGRFSRRTITKHITYILTGGQLGIEPGYVVLGLADDRPRGQSASEQSTNCEAVTNNSEPSP